MKAAIFNENIELVNDYKKPRPQEGEALVKVFMAGICNTDIEILKGYMGFKGIAGHEFAGEVVEINDVDQTLLNKRVVGDINAACYQCKDCMSGDFHHCPNRSVLGIFNRDGCFAQYLTLPIKNLLEVPDNISNESAVMTEPLAAAFEILDQIHIKPTDKVAVLGDGKLGLIIALTLNLTQADIILVGKHSDKLKIAQNEQVNTILLNEVKADMNKSFDVVVEATGSVSGFELAQRLVRPKGTIVLKSTLADNSTLNLASIVIDEIKIIGSRCGPFKPALKALAENKINVDPFISKIFKFSEIKEAFEYSQQKGVLKVLIDFCIK